MKKIYFSRDAELTQARLSKLIQYHRQHILPELQFNRGYYDGTGQQIMRREYEDPTKPNNRIVKNYCKTIVENFRGYISGIPATYTAPSVDDDISVLLECLEDNDVANTDSEWLKNALIYGQAPQLCYCNEQHEKRFRNLNPETVVPVYSDDLDEQLLYVIYYFPKVDWDSDAWEETFVVNVYDSKYIHHYETDSSFTDLKITDEPEEHYFSEVPFSIFYLTDDGESIFKCIIGLQDAYNKLLSDSVNDWESFVDAYLVLKNMTATEEDVADMKENRILMLDDDSDAFYLTKNSNDTQVQNLLDSINVAIHTIANSPDFSSEEFGSGVSSGIALQFKLVGFNHVAANIESNFKRAIYKRIDLLNNLFTLLDTEAFKVKVSFTHCLPIDIADIAENVNKLRGLVSTETLLAQIPFIDDVGAELDRLDKENNQLVNLYDFGNEI